MTNPAAPANFLVTDVFTTVQAGNPVPSGAGFSWDYATAPAASSFLVSLPSQPSFSSFVLAPDKRAFSWDTGQVLGTTATTLRALGADASLSDPASATAALPVTRPFSPPVPSLTAIQNGSGSVALAWAPMLTQPAPYDSVSIQAQLQGGDWQTLATGLPAATADYIATGLQPGGTYTFRVAAVKTLAWADGWAANGGLWSAPQTVTLTAAYDFGGLRTTAVGAASVSLAWDRLQVDVQTWTVQRGTGSGAPATLTSMIDGRLRGYQDATAQASTAYTYRVGGNLGDRTVWLPALQVTTPAS